MSQTQKDILKSENDVTLSDNRVLKTERILAASLILQHVFADSESLLDTYIKQHQHHWCMSFEVNAFTNPEQK